MSASSMTTSVELCAGGGGAALGLEQAGFAHQALAEIDPDACETLRVNRPEWKIMAGDLHDLDGRQFAGTDLVSGGVPCQPFSVAGGQLGAGDERDLFPEALRLVAEIMPRAVLLENIAALLDGKFAAYRALVTARLEGLGYRWDWRLLQASDYGVSQLRPRSVLVAMERVAFGRFAWPPPHQDPPPAVGAVLLESMRARGWAGAGAWAARADRIAPTLVGGSKRHGGADLGPTRAKREWRDRLGTNGYGVADEVPGPDFGSGPATPAQIRQRTGGMPKLTVAQTALIQGFPGSWEFSGRKTAAYRQIGNAFPPPVARALGESIRTALTS